MQDGEDESDVKVYGPTLTKSRCIAPVLGDDSHHRFLVGTCTLHSDNELHLFEYSGDDHEFCNMTMFPHAFEIWDITTSPTNDSQFFAVYNDNLQFKAALYEIASKEGESSTPPAAAAAGGSSARPKQGLKRLLVIDPSVDKVSDGQLRTVLWNRRSPSVATAVDSNGLYQWDLEKQALSSVLYSADRSVVAARRDPNFATKIGFAEQTSVSIIDTRDAGARKRVKPAVSIPKAHEYGVCDLDFNPVHFHTLVTAGEDFKIRFWDVRKTRCCLKVVGAHSHWVTRVRVNPLKDQLVLTSSTDGLVKLWDLSSVSSLSKAPSEGRVLEDRLVSEITEHQESVYSVAWSNFDSWVFVSVSYNGRVLLHHVPFETKDRILSGELA